MEDSGSEIDDPPACLSPSDSENCDSVGSESEEEEFIPDNDENCDSVGSESESEEEEFILEKNDFENSESEYDTEEEKRKRLPNLKRKHSDLSSHKHEHESSCNDVDVPVVKKKNQTDKLNPQPEQFVHKYRSEWKTQYNFDWLNSSLKGDRYFRCEDCNKDLKGGISEVKKHANSYIHQKAVAGTSKQPTLEQSLQNNNAQSISISQQVKENDIRAGFFIIEHNLAISLSDHLVDFSKTLDKKSVILQKFKCCRTKMTLIIQNIIGKYAQEEIFQIAREIQFSLIVDGSTDRNKVKHLALMMRFEKNFDSIDVFLGLLVITDCSANGIFTAITKFMIENGIPYKNNMVGFASDGENTMFGSNNSVVTKLQAELPELFTMKCICHSLSLAASAATKQLPDNVENLVSGIYGYMKNSSKRKINFELEQKILDLKPHKILKLCPTRWLSLSTCIDRIIEQYDALFNFFKAESETNVQSAREIYEQMQNPYTKLYLEFLSYVLPIVVNKNKEFQSEKPKLFKLYRKMASMYRTILEMFLKPSYMDNLDETDINFREPNNMKKLEELYLGPEVMAKTALMTQTSVNLRTFRTKCLNFLIELAGEIYKRFPFHDQNIRALKFTEFIDPTKIQSTVSIASIAKLLQKKANVDYIKADSEFQELKKYFRGDQTKDVQRFWNSVSRVKNGKKQSFRNVLGLVKYILTLPHSSATCERCFSQINLNKTKSRNRLESPTLRGCLYGKAYLHIKRKCCHDCDVSCMVPLHNSDNLYSKKA